MFRPKILISVFTAALALLGLFARETPAQEPSFEFLSQTPIVPTHDVAVSGGMAYIASHEYLYIYNVSNPASPEFEGSYYEPNCSFMAVDVAEPNTIVTQNFYICPPYNSLYILDTSNPDNPTPVDEPINIAPGGGSEIFVSGGYAYIANDTGGLAIVDIGRREEVGRFNPNPDIYHITSRIMDVKIVGNLAYLADGGGKMWVVNVEDKEHPTPVGPALNIEGGPSGIAVTPQYAYIASGSAGIRVVDISNPQSGISEVGNTPTAESISGIEVSGDFLFVGDDRGAVSAFTLSDPRHPSYETSYITTGNARKLALSGDLIFVADLQGGMVILRFTGLREDFLLDIPLLKQTDLAWAGLEYDDMLRIQYPVGAEYCGSTIGQCGCVITSLAMGLLYYQVDSGPLGGETTPASINDFFRSDTKPTTCTIKVGDKIKTYSGWSSKGYFCEGVRWTAVNQYTKDANEKSAGRTPVVEWVGTMSWANSDDFDQEIVRTDIKANNPVLLRVPGPQHWVLATGFSGNSILINDPAFEISSLSHPKYNDGALIIHRYEKVHTNLSTLEVGIVAPGQVLITDPLGRIAGLNGASQATTDVIPNSSYFFDPYLADDTTGAILPEDSGINWLVITDPLGGSYQVEVLTPEGQPYSLTVYAANRDGNLTFHPSFNYQSEEAYKYRFVYNPEPGEINISEVVDIDIKPGSSQNPVLLNDKNGVIPVAVFSTDTFDALQINHTTVRLLGATETHIDDRTGLIKRHEEDVNGDGRKDLVLHFKIKDLIGANLSKVWTIFGETYGGLRFEGKDSVVLINMDR